MQSQSPPPPTRFSDPTLLLKRLYLSYTCKGTRTKLDVLTGPKFIQLLKDASVIGESFSLKDADILVSKVVKRAATITFPNFCELIARLAKSHFEDLYSRVSPAAALSAFIQQYMTPLSHSELQEFERYENQEITDQCLEILREVKDVLSEMYIRNFPWELRSAEGVDVIQRRSEGTLMTLVVGLGIVPEVITKSAAAAVLHSTLTSSYSILSQLHMTDQGTVFTLDKFIIYLIRCGISSSAFPSSPEPHVSLALLFEVIEMSQGFPHFENICNRTHTAKMTLMTPKVMAVLEPMLSTEKSQSREVDLSAMPLPSEQLDQHIDSLEQIYHAYCSRGEPLNTTHMKAYKFLRILTDAGVLSMSKSQEAAEKGQGRGGVLTKHEANLIFLKVTIAHPKRSEIRIRSFRPTSYLASKDNEHGRMTFPQFLQALARVSQHISPNLPPDEAMLSLLETHILKLQQALVGHGLSTDKIKELLYELKDESVQNGMVMLTRCLEPFYRTYSDSKGFMNFDKYIRFCVDFELFPDIITKAKLVQFFVALASLYKKTSLGLTATLSLTMSLGDGLPIDQIDTEVIDLTFFVEGVALCALEGAISESTNEGKIIALLERMSQSKGPAVTQMRTGTTRNSTVSSLDFMKILKEYYPNLKKMQPVNSFVGFNEMVHPR